MKTFSPLIAATMLQAIKTFFTKASDVLSISVVACFLLDILFGSMSVSGQPSITSFAPISGPIGTTVIITGSNFSSTPSENIVYFGATKTAVTDASSTSLTVTVPIGATFQPITVTTNSLTAFSAKPFVVTFTGGGDAFTSSSFASKVNFETKSNPYQILSEDLDGDGNADIVTSNLGNDNFSVFKNTGSSGIVSFSTAVLYPLLEAPYAAKNMADFNGDGKLDLAFVRGAYSVSVYKNISSAGNITFDSQQNFLSDYGPWTPAFGDIDGDGKIDIVTVNGGANTFSVLKNTSTNGNISFAASIDFPSSANPRSLAITDFDNDGKPDILIVNIFGTNTISVFRNTSTSGSISFAAKVEYHTDGDDPYMAVGDLDGDNKTDIVVVNAYSNSISIYRNMCLPGTIAFAPKINYTPGSGPWDVAIGDLNGDGKPDLAVACAYSNLVSVFKNTSVNGTISFAAKVDFSVGTNPTNVTIGDFDTDGLPDIAVANQYSTFISVLRNQIVSTGHSCAVPPALTTANITGTSAKLGWDAVAGAEGYKVRYKVANTTEWKMGITYHNNKPISGLLPNTVYKWEVQTFCQIAPSIMSEWSEKQEFTTGSLRLGDEPTLSLELYPNPVSEHFTLDLQLSSSIDQSADIFLLNALGQIIYSSHQVVNGELKKEIAMPSTASSGWYIVRVVSNDQVIEKKLLYQK